VKDIDLGFLEKKEINDISESFAGLLQVIKKDRELNARVIQLLELNSFRRRLLLNKWLEQLRLKKAPDRLTQALSCLLDDTIAGNTLKLIENINLNNNAGKHS
jgi:hypothetical protein